MGVYTLARGKGSYEGEWRNGKAHGVGKFTGPTGEEVRTDASIYQMSCLDSVILFDFCQVEGIWDNGTLKPQLSGVPVDETAAAIEEEDSYNDSFDDGIGGSGNGSEEDRDIEVVSDRDTDRLLSAQESHFQAPPASALPLYDVTSSQFVVHVQQQPSSVGIVGNIQGPVRPLKVKKTTAPSFIGLKIRLKVCKGCLHFSAFFFC
jgi:hypothetical protein